MRGWAWLLLLIAGTAEAQVAPWPAGPIAGRGSSPDGSAAEGQRGWIGQFAPKGMPGRAVPRIAGALTYHYNSVGDSRPSHGAAANLLQAKPKVAGVDYHSLAEIAVESADVQQIVEIGWTVDRGVNGDLEPRVFVFHWIDGKAQCYNGCGWVQVSATARPGMAVVPGETHRYAIQLDAGDWWLSFDGERMGYFPGSRWGGRFTEGGVSQWFGEVAATSDAPCTEMGNGKPGDDPDAAAFANLVQIGLDGGLYEADTRVFAEPEHYYRLGATTPSGFRFGGPGGGACCVPLACDQVSAACGEPVEPLCGKELDCGGCGDAATCAEDHTCTGPPPSSGGCAVGGSPGVALALLALRRRFRPGGGKRRARGRVGFWRGIAAQLARAG